MSSLDIDIIGRIAQFQDSLDQVSRSAQKMQKDMSASTELLRRAWQGLLSTLTVGAFVSAIKGAIDLGDSFNDLGTRTGLTADQLLILKGAADRSGSSLEGLDTLASKIPKVMKEAGDAGSYAARAIKALGVDPKQGLTDLYGYLVKVGQGLDGFNDGAGKSALAIAALGKGGDKLIGLAQSIAETEERFKRLGITMSEDFKAKADQFNDTLNDIADLSKHSAREIAVGLLPTLQALADAFIDAKKEGGGFQGLGEALGKELRHLGEFVVTTRYEIESLVHAFKNLKELAALPFSTEKFSDLSKRMQAEADGIRQRYEKALEAVNRTASAADDSSSGKKRKDAPTPPSDEALRKAEAAAKAKESLDQAITKVALEREKALAQARQSILDAYYQQGLISDQQYYEARKAIADDALAAETDALDGQIARQLAIFKKAAAGTKEYYEAQKQLVESVEKRNALQAAGQNRAILDDIAASKAADEYADAIGRVNAQIARLQGDSARAATIDFAQQYRALINKATAGGDSGRMASIETLKQLSIAQAEYTDLQTRSGQVEQALEAQELRIRTSREVGALSELEGLRLTAEARQRALPQLQELADKMRGVAIASGNAKLISDADTFAAKIDQLAKQADALGLKVSGVFSDQSAQAFTDFATGAKTAGEAFQSFVKGVLNELVRLEAQAAASKLFGQGSGFFSAIGSLFGGKTGLASTPGGSVTGDTGSDWSAGLKAIASRAPLASGGSDVSVVQHITIGGGVTRADVLSGMAIAQSNAVKEIRDGLQRRAYTV